MIWRRSYPTVGLAARSVSAVAASELTGTMLAPHCAQKFAAGGGTVPQRVQRGSAIACIPRASRLVIPSLPSETLYRVGVSCSRSRGLARHRRPFAEYSHDELQRASRQFPADVTRVRINAASAAFEEADAMLVIGSSVMVYSGYGCGEVLTDPVETLSATPLLVVATQTFDSARPRRPDPLSAVFPPLSREFSP